MALASARPLPVPPIPKSLAASRINPRVIVGVLVLLGAILGLTLVYRGAQPRTMQVVRAARDVAPGDVLQLSDLQAVDEALPDNVAAGLVPASERATLVGRRLAQPLYAGDFVTRRESEPLTRQLAANERLYALDVPSQTMLGLQLQPNDSVEIVVTTSKTQPQAAETHVVLPSVAIFSVGGAQTSSAFGVNTSGDRTGANQTTTLVLRTDEAGYQALAKAREIGDLDLALIGSPEPAP